GRRGAVESPDERRLDRVAAVEARAVAVRPVFGDGPSADARLADDDAGAALDLDLRVAGLDREPLHGASLEALDEVARLLPDGADELLVRRRLSLRRLIHSRRSEEHTSEL